MIKESINFSATIQQHNDMNAAYVVFPFDVQKLFDKYAGTCFVERQRDGKVRKNTELVIASDFQGIAVNLEGNFKTNMFKIHHSKNRTHIVPIKKGD